MTAADELALIEAALAETPAGVVSIKYADGRQVTYDRAYLDRRRAELLREVHLPAGEAAGFRRLGLRGDA